jgi:uncharacterized membrane protein YebE (DUF533 family)
VSPLEIGISADLQNEEEFMANALDILGDLMQAGITKSGNDRVRHALDPDEQEQGGLGGILDQLAKQFGGSGNGGDGNLLDNLAKMAKQVMDNPKGAVTEGNPLAIGGLGALAGAILGNPGGATKGALGTGALALLAMLAKSALSSDKGGGKQQALADLGQEDWSAPKQKDLEARADLILSAMINAAKADGKIDQQELNLIVGRLESTGADQAARTRVRDELQQPLDIDRLVRAVPDREAGVQIYAASLLATEADTEAERVYLKRLASALRLDAPVVAYVHRELGMAA